MTKTTRHFTGQEQCSTCTPSTAVWKATMTTTELRFHEEEDGAITHRHIFSRHELARAGNTIHFHSDGVSSSLTPGEGSRKATITLAKGGFVVEVGTGSEIVFTERHGDEVDALEKLIDIANDELVISAKAGDLEKVRQLLTREHAPADITHDSYMAFNRACRDGQFEVVKYMLTSAELTTNADPSSADYYSLRFACTGTTKNHFEIVKFLLTGGLTVLDIHVLKEYPLKAACQFGNLETVKFLLTSPMIAEHSDPYVLTHDLAYSDSLAFAAYYEQKEVIDWLIFEYGYIASPETTQLIKDRGNFEILEKLKLRDFSISLEKTLSPKNDDPPTRQTKI